MFAMVECVDKVLVWLAAVWTVGVCGETYVVFGILCVKCTSGYCYVYVGVVGIQFAEGAVPYVRVYVIDETKAVSGWCAAYSCSCSLLCNDRS